MTGRNGKCPRKPHQSRFPELPPKYSASRELRNKAEKLRRIRLNNYLNDIKSLVPVVADKTKKSDTTRTNILRLSANYIRLSKLFPAGSCAPVSGHIINSLEHIESQQGTFFLLSEKGRILFVGEGIAKYTGWTQLDLFGQYINDFIHPSDRHKLEKNLERDSCEAGEGSSSSSHLRSICSPGTSAATHTPTKAVRKSFYLRVKEKPSNRSDRPRYEHMFIIGHYRKSTEAEKNISKDLEHVFVGLMKPVKDRPISELNLMEAIQDQYVTRHLPDGRIIYSDQRISTVAGYLPAEVKGKSAFNFMLGEDLPWTTIALRTMFANPKGVGLVTYRLKTRTGGVICLQSRGYLELEKDTKKIDHFVCINSRIPPTKEEQYMEEQRERFTPYIAELQNSGFNDLSSLPIMEMERDCSPFDVPGRIRSISSSVQQTESQGAGRASDPLKSFSHSLTTGSVKSELSDSQQTPYRLQSSANLPTTKLEPTDLLDLIKQDPQPTLCNVNPSVGEEQWDNPLDVLQLRRGEKRKIDLIAGDSSEFNAFGVSRQGDNTIMSTNINKVLRTKLESDQSTQDVDFFEILNEKIEPNFQQPPTTTLDKDILLTQSSSLNINFTSRDGEALSQSFDRFDTTASSPFKQRNTGEYRNVLNTLVPPTHEAMHHGLGNLATLASPINRNQPIPFMREEIQFSPTQTFSGHQQTISNLECQPGPGAAHANTRQLSVIQRVVSTKGAGQEKGSGIGETFFDPETNILTDR